MFLSNSIGRFLSAGEGTDFFEQVGIVRSRSRRDFINMATDPVLREFGVHKFASMDKTVVVPTKGLISLDLGLFVPFFEIRSRLLLFERSPFAGKRYFGFSRRVLSC